MDQSYAADVCMEPLFWFVDNFTHIIGPVIFLNEIQIFILKIYILVICLCCNSTNRFRCWNCILDRPSILVESKSLHLYRSSHNRTLAIN